MSEDLEFIQAINIPDFSPSGRNSLLHRLKIWIEDPESRFTTNIENLMDNVFHEMRRLYFEEGRANRMTDLYENSQKVLASHKCEDLHCECQNA